MGSLRSDISGLRFFGPMVWAIAATFVAAGLVLYFQHRALAALDSQTRVTSQQISEQTATDIAFAARRALDGPVFDTLTAVNHPELRAGRLDLVATEFEEGLRTYPHVDRFFVWTAETEAVARGQALFVGRDDDAGVPLVRTGADVRLRGDADLGRSILQLARQHSGDQHIYVAAEGVGPAGRYQAFLRLFWTDARRVEYFAVLGFVVDPSTLGPRLFASLFEREIGPLLARRGGDMRLGLRVTDDRGGLVYGESLPAAASAAVPLAMLFYPVDRIESRLSTAVVPRRWQIEVSAPIPADGLIPIHRGYWPTVVSVVLMLVALALTVQANRRAEELARMQADFISHVSHQLKTPLSLLTAATETVAMERVRSPEKLSQYVEIIRSEVARLSALVQRILESARLQQPRSYEFEDIDLGALVRETVAAFETSLSSRRFTFRVVEPPGRSPRVSADPAALEQVLANLLDNAVKYSGPSREVVVRVGRERGHTFFEVKDRGVGVPPADIDRIFEKFYRGPSASLNREGFGLGLPIVQELVHAHRGRVEVHSVEHEGSTFRVLLPSPRSERIGVTSDSADVEVIS